MSEGSASYGDYTWPARSIAAFLKPRDRGNGVSDDADSEN